MFDLFRYCGWLLAAGYWRLATGGWQLAAGYWQLATRGWQLAAGNWQLPAAFISFNRIVPSHWGNRVILHLQRNSPRLL